VVASGDRADKVRDLGMMYGGLGGRIALRIQDRLDFLLTPGVIYVQADNTVEKPQAGMGAYLDLGLEYYVHVRHFSVGLVLTVVARCSPFGCSSPCADGEIHVLIFQALVVEVQGPALKGAERQQCVELGSSTFAPPLVALGRISGQIERHARVVSEVDPYFLGRAIDAGECILVSVEKNIFASRLAAQE